MGERHETAAREIVYVSYDIVTVNFIIFFFLTWYNVINASAISLLFKMFVNDNFGL